MSSEDEGASRQRPTGKRLLTLSVAALGVVYGDIGTSPLYAVRECFTGHAQLQSTPANVMGVLSLIFWSLVLVVSVKYLGVVMRAHNQGEGGILALMALVQKVKGKAGELHLGILVLGLFGAALLYGDGIITPAISVMSAVEGIAVFQPKLEPYIVPIAVVILVGLFVIQRKGTGSVGAIFGPVTFLWFGALIVLGVRGILLAPEVLLSLNPVHAVTFFLHNGWHGFLVLGAVFLVVTGGEALYADMGHFGARPIRLTWFVLVLPALLINYFGQGALVLAHPEAVQNPFYLLAPSWALLPMVVLSTAAACIASQAVISGAFSLTRQAVQLGFCPRMEIVHTSETQIGQIYVPTVNWALLAAVIALVVGFGSSSGLAAAYGIAVSSTMVITAILAFFVARDHWRWNTAAAIGVFGTFLIIDSAFLAANGLKIVEGGWLPLLLAATIFTMMTTWKRGRSLLAERLREASLPLSVFLEGLNANPPTRVHGTAVFLTSNPEGTPPALLHNLKHNKVIHQRVLLVTVETLDVPHVPNNRRVEMHPLNNGFYRVIARYGFMQSPTFADLLPLLESGGLPLRMMDTSFFLGRETLIASSRKGLHRWRKHLFGWMSKNARSATAYFALPPNRVVELGAQIEL